MSKAFRERDAPCRMVRLKNRRVYGKRCDGEVSFRFKKLVGRDIEVQRIRLTDAAVMAMLSIAVDLGVFKK